MVVIGVPVERTASRFAHQATATGTTKRSSSYLALGHNILSLAQARTVIHPLRPVDVVRAPRASLHDAPDATNFTEGDANLAKGAAARAPTIIRDGQRAAIPAARSPPGLAFFGEAA